MPVTEDIGAWGSSRTKFRHSINHDLIPVFTLQADDVQRDIRHGAYLSGILYIFFPGAGAQKTQFILHPYFQVIDINASLWIPGFYRKEGDGTIHSSG